MILQPPSDFTLVGLGAWARQLVTDLNRFFTPPNRWPVHADDAAAADARLKVGDPYVTPDGQMRRRVS